MKQIGKTIFVAGFSVILICTLIFGLGNALMPLLIAFALAYLSFPLINRLEKKGIRRNYVVVGVLILITLLFLVVLLVMIPILLEEITQFFNELPQTSSVAIEKIKLFANRFGYKLDFSQESLNAFVIEHSSALSGEVLASTSNFLKGIFSNFIRVILGFLNLFLIPIFFFHLVNQYEEIYKRFKEIMPPAWHSKFREYTELTNEILSGYIRGQVLVALFLAMLYGFGFWVIGLRFGLLIGLVTGLMSFIPFVGSLLGFTAAMIVALANFTGLGIIVAVVIVFSIVQGLEGFVITPKLVGHKVGLGVLSTMLALIIGGNLFGFAGMMIAIPAAAITKAVLKDLKSAYLSLEFYTGQAD